MKANYSFNYNLMILIYYATCVIVFFFIIMQVFLNSPRIDHLKIVSEMSRSNMKYGRYSPSLPRWNHWNHLRFASLAVNLKINITINCSKLTVIDTSLSWRYTNLWNVFRTDVWEALRSILHTVNWKDWDHRSYSPKINYLFHGCVVIWCEVVTFPH